MRVKNHAARKDGWIEIFRPEVYEWRYYNTRTQEGRNDLPDYPPNPKCPHCGQELELKEDQ